VGLVMGNDIIKKGKKKLILIKREKKGKWFLFVKMVLIIQKSG